MGKTVKQIQKENKWIPKLNVSTNKNPVYYALVDLEGNVTHILQIFKDFVSIRPVNHINFQHIITEPDKSLESEKDYDTSIYIARHAQILVKGEPFAEASIRVEATEDDREKPTNITVDVGQKQFNFKDKSEDK
jgi:hypothetical protein